MAHRDEQAGDGWVTQTRHWDVPDYRMRGLARRLNSLIPHVERYGHSLSYDITRSVRMVPPIDCYRTLAAPRITLDSVTVSDDIMADGFPIVALIDRRGGYSLMPTSGRPVDGEPVPILRDGNPDGIKANAYDSMPSVEEVIGEEWMTDLTKTPTCHKCGHEVGNGITYLVVDEATDEPFQVGGCCISHYAGGLPAQYVRRYVDIVSQMRMFSMPRQRQALPWDACLVNPEAMVAYALHQIRYGNGYEIWDQSRNMSTAMGAVQYARRILDNGDTPGFGWGSHSDLGNGNWEELVAEATQAVEWARDGFPEMSMTGWKEAVSQAFRQGCDGLVEIRQREVVTAIARAWVAHCGSEQAFADSAWLNPRGGNWVGSIDGKIRVRIVRSYLLSRMMRTIFGIVRPSAQYALLTEDGDILVWRTTKADIPETGFDSPKELVATVTAHMRYHGHRETLIANGHFLTQRDYGREAKRKTGRASATAIAS